MSQCKKNIFQELWALKNHFSALRVQHGKLFHAAVFVTQDGISPDRIAEIARRDILLPQQAHFGVSFDGQYAEHHFLFATHSQVIDEFVCALAVAASSIKQLPKNWFNRIVSAAEAANGKATIQWCRGLLSASSRYQTPDLYTDWLGFSETRERQLVSEPHLPMGFRPTSAFLQLENELPVAKWRELHNGRFPVLLRAQLAKDLFCSSSQAIMEVLLDQSDRIRPNKSGQPGRTNPDFQFVLRAFLQAHHDGPNGPNDTPLTSTEMAVKLKTNQTKISRAMSQIFRGGCKEYRRRVANRSLGDHLRDRNEDPRASGDFNADQYAAPD